jgi:hypothetical protein
MIYMSSFKDKLYLYRSFVYIVQKTHQTQSVSFFKISKKEDNMHQTTYLWLKLIVCSSFIFAACGDEEPEGTSIAGTMTAGTTMAGTTMAGTTMAGTTMTSGEMTGGEMTSGEMTGGEMTGGEMTGGEMTGGEMTGGEMTGGEMTGGEMTGGEMTGGEMTGGEMTGGETAGVEIGEGACTNPADLAQFETLGEAGLEEAIGGCVAMCFIPDSPGCGTCISGATGLSEACTACFVEVTECTVASCVAQCINPASPECAQCREDNCNEAFTMCSGVAP